MTRAGVNLYIYGNTQKLLRNYTVSLAYLPSAGIRFIQIHPVAGPLISSFAYPDIFHGLRAFLLPRATEGKGG